MSRSFGNTRIVTGKETWPPRIVEHYTPEEKEKFLADKTFFFIRDSRLRYQSMNLTALLISKGLTTFHDYILYDASEDNQNAVIDP